MIVKYDYCNKEENDTSLNKIGLQTAKYLYLKAVKYRLSHIMLMDNRVYH